MKIVIANSIGKDKYGNYIIHSPSRWSEAVKSKFHWFAYYPWELAYLSSLLKQETKNKIKFVDGCLMRLDQQAYYKYIVAEKPDMLIMESATRMIDENVALALELKKTLGTRLVFVGQHASAVPEELMRKGIDEVCVGEYEYTVLDIVQGKTRSDILGLYPNSRRPLLDINNLPWPEDHDVRRMDYGIPGEPSSEYREIQMYASRGCPGSCNFCVARHVYYNIPNWRNRDITDIINEIMYLRGKYPGLQGIFFDEEAHNANRKFTLDLTRAIIAAGLNDLKYEAMCDLRFLDQEVLESMKKAGYYKIRVGIETASEKVMRAIGKMIDVEQIKSTLAVAKKTGLKTYGTFTFGAWGADKQEDEKTVGLMRELIARELLDNVQLSICTPQPGTPFYTAAKENGFLLDGKEYEQYDGGSVAIIRYPHYNETQIKNMKQRALIIRDHWSLKVKCRHKKFLRWVFDGIQRYGVIGTCLKAWRRVILEIKFLRIHNDR